MIDTEVVLISKEVCNRCTLEAFRKLYSHDRDYDEAVSQHSFERRWWQGLAPCVKSIIPGVRSHLVPNEGVPQWCTHRFEHAVAVGMTNAK